MRHNFVNDIGDYVTYALLRALCASGPDRVRLGVIWYLTRHVEVNGDGRHRAHLSRDGWEQLDAPLLAQMRAIEAGLGAAAELHIRLIERSAILPPDTVYVSEPLPGPAVPAAGRVDQRQEWFARAREAVAGCNLIFLDPDNGLEVASVPPGSPMAGKYATCDEIAELLSSGAGVVLYQHGDRSPWPAQRARVIARIESAFARPLSVQCLRFSAFGARAFFCLATRPETTETITTALTAIRDRTAPWNRARYLQFA